MSPRATTGNKPPRGLWVLLLYPPAALAASFAGMPWLKGMFLPALVILLAWRPLARGSAAAWMILLGLCLLAAACMRWPMLAALLPAAAVLALAGWFWWSLLPHTTPLIRRFARVVHESQGQAMPENSERWLWGWTAVWALALTVFGGVTAWLAASGQEFYWLLWVFAGLPVALGLLLGVEYLLRLRRFPDYPHLNWTGFLRVLGAIRWHHLAS